MKYGKTAGTPALQILHGLAGRYARAAYGLQSIPTPKTRLLGRAIHDAAFDYRDGYAAAPMGGTVTHKGGGSSSGQMNAKDERPTSSKRAWQLSSTQRM